MTDEKTYTESEAHLYFAKHYNNKTWELLEQPKRTPEENEQMVDFAHASLAHWRTAGTGVRHQRGEWMLARVYTVVGEKNLALYHARRCKQILDNERAEMQDFDLAFASEALARAYALNGDTSEAQKFLEEAQKAGEAIADEEDRKIFFNDINSGEWFGLK